MVRNLANDPSPGIFVSHAHDDRRIADALSQAVDTLFGARVPVSYSTKRSADGGIRAGENWFRWIGEQVRTSRVTVVLLTPNSVVRPWLLWETGAVYGAALAKGTENAPSVRPLIYRLSDGDIPSPLRAANLQTLHGDSSYEMKQFFVELFSDFDVLSPTQVMQAGQRLDAVLETYIAEVEFALDDSPTIPLEGVTQKWPALKQLLALTINALQAFYPGVKINGRYFYATVESGRDFLIQADEVYHESVSMPDEFGYPKVDIEADADTLVICQSFLTRKPMYVVLGDDLRSRYRPDLGNHIDPTQGWVLACPVLVRTAKPLGVVCLYGQKPPARNDRDVVRFKQVAVTLSEVFARTLQRGPAS